MYISDNTKDTLVELKEFVTYKKDKIQQENFGATLEKKKLN